MEYKSLDFYRPLPKPYQVRISKVMGCLKGAERIERAVRLYCTQYAQSWSLQVRGPEGTGLMGYTDGKRDMIANASLGKDDLIALRDAINEALAEA